MSLFRRKREGEDGRDKRPLPPPARESEPNEPSPTTRPLLGGPWRPAGWTPEQIETAEDWREIEDSFAGAITAPAPGEIVSGLVEVRVLSAAPVPEPVALRLEWSRDEVSWQSADSGGADDQSGLGAEILLPLLHWNTSSLPDGACFLRLVSSDSGGADTYSEPISLQIDNLGPEVHLREQLAGRTLSGLVTVSVDAEDLVSGVSLVELEISSGDERWRRVSEARTAPFALRLSTEELTDGQWALRVAARDGSGNQSRSEPWTVEIANTTAAAELIEPGEHLRGHVNLIARAADSRSTQMIFEIAATGSDEWRALGTARAPFHLPVDTRQLVDGIYELRIESLTAGGQSTYSRCFGPYTVDNTPPSIAIVEPHEGDTLKGWVELVAEARDDTSGVVRVELSYAEAGEWRLMAELEPQDNEVRGFWQTDECSPGACRLRATAFDRAGNKASHVIAVTITPAPPQSEPASEEAAPAPGPEPVRSAPSSARSLSPEAAGRFGQVPNWDWTRPARAEPAESGAESTPSEPIAEQQSPTVKAEVSAAGVPRPEPQPVANGVAWRWKAPQASEEPEPKPEPEPEPEPELEPEPEPELKSEPALEATPAPAIRLVEPLQAEEPEADSEERVEAEAPAQERKKDPVAASGAEEGGSVVNFPRVARGWDIWELSELVEETLGQDPAQEEERRQILYHLREHTAVDGRIPPEFEGLIYEFFGELMPDDSGV
jgi:hypothetical protein